MRVPFLDHPRPVAFAHRGGAAHAPENSWTAFEHAVKLGYAYLETDARATSDRQLVAFHDRTLDRVTDATGPIDALPYHEVAALRISGTEPIPLIEDLLGAWPDVRLNIDLKDAAGISLLPEVLRRTGAWDRVLRDLVFRPQAPDGPGPARPAGLHGDLASGDRGRLVQRRVFGALAADPAVRRLPVAGLRALRSGAGAAWPPRPLSAGRTRSAWTSTSGPSTTGPR